MIAVITFLVILYNRSLESMSGRAATRTTWFSLYDDPRTGKMRIVGITVITFPFTLRIRNWEGMYGRRRDT